MIIEYDETYIEQVKDLFVELQKYMTEIDREGYSVITRAYRKNFFEKTMNEIHEYGGKMYLYKENDQILGLVVGIINNDEVETCEFSAPRRGRITELVVSSKARRGGIGTKLLNKITTYLRKNGCEDILIGILAYNRPTIEFYKKNGYHIRLVEMTSNHEEK